MHLNPKDRVFALTVVGGYAVVSVTAWRLMGPSSLVVMVTVLLAVLLLINLETFRRLSDPIREYRHLQSLFDLYAVLDIHEPLPLMRGWAISPDFARLLVSLIRSEKPDTLVELGAGASTVVIAYCLKQLGRGHLTTVEHEERHAASTARDLARHGLQEWVTMVNAPLVDVKIEGTVYRWYDVDRLKSVVEVDLLLVDGPPGIPRRLSRYPALPLLHERLSPGACVVLDDAARKDERRILTRWQAEYPALCREDIPTEKGAVLLWKGGGAVP